MAQKKKKGGKPPRAQNGEWDLEVDPQEVRFMHSKISPVFSDGREVTQTLQEILSGSLKPEDLPKITVVVQNQGEVTAIFVERKRKEFWSYC
jgi:hypothetical protein